ncbi:MAG: hypothetical protein AAFX90_13990 [Pseudomonadota bacterium]
MMALKKSITHAIIPSIVLFTSWSTVALSQEQTTETEAQTVVVETFEGEDQTLMLGGQIFFAPSNSDWMIYVSNGDLVMENRKNPQSLHFNDIAWVKFPDTETIEPTEDMIVSAIVESENDANGGVGILVGSGKSGKYLALTVDGQGRFHVAKKDGRQLRSIHSAKHEAIKVGESNELSFRVRGAHVLFYVNGTKVIQVPFSKRSTNSRNSDGATGIGLAAYGLGKFHFEEVEISRPN